MRVHPLVPLALLLGAVLSCAPREQLCVASRECGQGLDCVAGMCEGAPSPLAGSRRLVLRPVAIAVVEAGQAGADESLPALVTLGSAQRGAALLLRFELRLERGAKLLRASVTLDRDDARLADPQPIRLHAERIIARWDPRRVAWATFPPVQDTRSPRTLVHPEGPRRVRVDVTELARRWLARDAGDQGVAVVAEDASPTGVSFALASSPLDAPDVRRNADADEPMPPTLEVYAR